MVDGANLWHFSLGLKTALEVMCKGCEPCWRVGYWRHLPPGAPERGEGGAMTYLCRHQSRVIPGRLGPGSRGVKCGDSARWVQRLLLGLPALPSSAFPSSPIGTSQNLLQGWVSIRPRPILPPPLGCQVSSFPFLLLLSGF